MTEDMIHDQCGVFGIFGTPRAAELTYLGLYALQHRGQESAGIVTSDHNKIHLYKGMGQVSEVFSQPDTLARLTGSIAMGHTRYSTTGASSIVNIQPFIITNRSRNLAIAHNGNLTNSLELRTQLDARGSIFQTTSDTEAILHLVATSKKGARMERICDALGKIRGAFSLVMLTDSSIIAARDPQGFRPLALGKLGRGWVVASETCAFDIIGAKYVRDIEPSEVIEITREGYHVPVCPTAQAALVVHFRIHLLLASGLHRVRGKRR